jgi:hypothetical protein
MALQLADQAAAVDSRQTPEEIELAAIKLKRAQLAEAREARAEPTAAELVAVEKRQLAEDEAFDAAIAEHGAKRVEFVRGRDGAIVLKRPHMATYRKFQDNGSLSSDSVEALVKPCIVWPSKAEFDVLVKDEPALLQRCANAVCALAGVRSSDAAGK